MDNIIDNEFDDSELRRPKPRPASQWDSGPRSGGGQSHGKKAYQGSGSRSSQSIIYHLWRFGDVQMIDDLADKWIEGIKPNMSWMYLTVFLALTIVTWTMAWHMDIAPSYKFASFIGGTSAVVFLASLMPNLLEFFGAGFALAGNLAIEIALKLFIVFDAITDAPASYQWSQKVVEYFATPGADPQLIFWVEIILTAPILFTATVVIETIFLSFVLADIRLLQKALGWGR